MFLVHQGDSSSRWGETQNDRRLYIGQGEEAAMRCTIPYYEGFTLRIAASSPLDSPALSSRIPIPSHRDGMRDLPALPPFILSLLQPFLFSLYFIPVAAFFASSR
jgi:hypothetical protein